LTDDDTITFEVLGIPAPQGSKSVFVNPKTGKPILADANPKKLKEWRTVVAEAAQVAIADSVQHTTLTEPVTVRMIFRFPAVKSDPDRVVHIVKPDVDKLIRSTLDALVHGGLLADDSQVFSVQATKAYCRDTDQGAPGATIVIHPYGDWEQKARAVAKEMRLTQNKG
jgi:Holliday junction resolvase RusA-like endonuclease